MEAVAALHRRRNALAYDDKGGQVARALLYRWIAKGLNLVVLLHQIYRSVECRLVGADANRNRISEAFCG
jgi:hypothetical protein